MNTLSTFVKQHRLITFIVLAYALSWWNWIVKLAGVPIASFGPFLAALVVLGLTEGRLGVKNLLARMVRWRVGVQWYLIALGLPLLMGALASYLIVLRGAPAPTMQQIVPLPEIIGTFAIVLLVPGFGGAWEEPGWRGYLVHRLEDRWSRLWALLPLWLIISLWHLPLFLSGDGGLPDVFNMIGGVIVYTWLYHRTGHSVLLVMIIHAANNTANQLYSPLFPEAYLGQLAWMKALVWGVVGLIVVVGNWRWWTQPDSALPRKAKPALDIG